MGCKLGDAAPPIHPSIQHPPTNHLVPVAELGARDLPVNETWFLSLRDTQ